MRYLEAKRVANLSWPRFGGGDFRGGGRARSFAVVVFVVRALVSFVFGRGSMSWGVARVSYLITSISTTLVWITLCCSFPWWDRFVFVLIPCHFTFHLGFGIFLCKVCRKELEASYSLLILSGNEMADGKVLTGWSLDVDEGLWFLQLLFSIRLFWLYLNLVSENTSPAHPLDGLLLARW